MPVEKPGDKNVMSTITAATPDGKVQWSDDER